MVDVLVDVSWKGCPKAVIMLPESCDCELGIEMQDGNKF
jgi:hypothetical protein